MPVSVPSPVVARSAKITCPDCSPPSDRPRSSSAVEHVAVADGRLDHLDAVLGERAAQTEVRHHGRDDGVASELAAFVQIERDDRQHLVAVDEVAALVDRDHTVGVAVEREAGVARPRATTACWSSAGSVEPQPALMLVPSGSSWSTSHPRARAHAGPTARPRRRRRCRSRPRPTARRAGGRPSAADEVGDVVGGRAEAVARRRPRRALRDRRRRRRRRAARSSVSICSSGVVGDLAAARARRASRRCRGTGCGWRRSPPPARRTTGRGTRRRGWAARRRARRRRPRCTGRRRARPRAAARNGACRARRRTAGRRRARGPRRDRARSRARV